MREASSKQKWTEPMFCCDNLISVEWKAKSVVTLTDTSTKDFCKQSATKPQHILLPCLYRWTSSKMRRITVIWTPLLTTSLKLRLVLLGMECSVVCYVLSGWQQIGFCSAHGHRANDCTLYHTINGAWKPRAYNRNSAVTQQDAYDTQEYTDREAQVSLILKLLAQNV